MTFNPEQQVITGETALKKRSGGPGRRTGHSRKQRERPFTRRSAAGGFTLVDMLITLLILGILTLAALPAVSSILNSNRLDAAARDVVYGLEYARRLAIRHQRNFTLEVDITQNRVVLRDTRYKGDAARHLDADPPVDTFGRVFDPLNKAVFMRDFDELSQFEGVHITWPAAVTDITYTPHGHLTGGNAGITLNLKADQCDIKVDGTTGILSVN